MGKALEQLVELKRKPEAKEAEPHKFGGSGPFNLPDDHKPFMQSPVGFSCAECVWYNPGGAELKAGAVVTGHTCGSSYYQDFMGTDELPDGDPHLMCSDWFAPPTEQKAAPP